jgi:hypothetical protein
MTPDKLTNVNEIGLTATILLCILIIIIPRRYAILPIILAGTYITLGQVLLFLGLHFTMLRIVILFGWLRVLFRGELEKIKINRIDKVLTLWVLTSFIVFTARWGTMDAFINRLGFAYNALGMYFLFRMIIRDSDDLCTALKMLAIIITPLAIFMMIEQITGTNMFSIFGGVPEISWERGARLRSQGPFVHAILAGTFGATLMPLFVGIFFKEKSKYLGIIGIISATIITITSTSGGPFMAFMFAILGLIIWPLRNQMRPIFWGSVIFLITIQLFMKAPIWYLMTRISGVVGGTGWHRSYLIDQAVEYWNEWWLFGTNSTAHWMPYTLPSQPDMADITNQYIWEGINGGLLAMILFILIIVLSFKIIGKGIRILSDAEKKTKYLLWTMGSALAAHAISFFSVSYFDQLMMFWYLLIAFISASTVAMGISEREALELENESIKL